MKSVLLGLYKNKFDLKARRWIIFLRKKKLLKQIEQMLEDCEFHKEKVYKLDTNEHKQKREIFLAKQAELLDLQYWINHGESIRPLYDRKRHFGLR